MATPDGQPVGVVMLLKTDAVNIPPHLLQNALEQNCDDCGAVCLNTPVADGYPHPVDYWLCMPCAVKRNPNLTPSEPSDVMKEKLREAGIDPNKAWEQLKNIPIREM